MNTDKKIMIAFSVDDNEGIETNYSTVVSPENGIDLSLQEELFYFQHFLMCQTYSPAAAGSIQFLDWRIDHPDDSGWYLLTLKDRETVMPAIWNKDDQLFHTVNIMGEYLPIRNEDVEGWCGLPNAYGAEPNCY